LKNRKVAAASMVRKDILDKSSLSLQTAAYGVKVGKMTRVKLFSLFGTMFIVSELELKLM